MKRVRGKKSFGRAGFTMVELALVIGIVIVVVSGGLAGYKKIYIPMKGDAAFKQIASVTTAIERTTMSNNNVYPVANTAAIDSINVITNELGGINNSLDVAKWTYRCTAGAGQRITVVTTAYDDPTVASIASQKVNTSLSPWTSVVAGNVITLTLANVTCN